MSGRAENRLFFMTDLSLSLSVLCSVFSVSWQDLAAGQQAAHYGSAQGLM